MHALSSSTVAVPASVLVTVGLSSVPASATAATRDIGYLGPSSTGVSRSPTAAQTRSSE